MSGPKVVLVVGGSESVTTVLSALGLGAVWDDGAVALWVPAGSERARLEATGQLSLLTGAPSGADLGEARE